MNLIKRNNIQSQIHFSPFDSAINKISKEMRFQKHNLRKNLKTAGDQTKSLKALQSINIHTDSLNRIKTANPNMINSSNSLSSLLIKDSAHQILSNLTIKENDIIKQKLSNINTADKYKCTKIDQNIFKPILTE